MKSFYYTALEALSDTRPPAGSTSPDSQPQVDKQKYDIGSYLQTDIDSMYLEDEDQENMAPEGVTTPFRFSGKARTKMEGHRLASSSAGSSRKLERPELEQLSSQSTSGMTATAPRLHTATEALRQQKRQKMKHESPPYIASFELHTGIPPAHALAAPYSDPPQQVLKTKGRSGSKNSTHVVIAGRPRLQTSEPSPDPNLDAGHPTKKIGGATSTKKSSSSQTRQPVLPNASFGQPRFEDSARRGVISSASKKGEKENRKELIPAACPEDAEYVATDATTIHQSLMNLPSVESVVSIKSSSHRSNGNKKRKSAELDSNPAGSQQATSSSVQRGPLSRQLNTGSHQSQKPPRISVSATQMLPAGGLVGSRHKSHSRARV